MVATKNKKQKENKVMSKTKESQSIQEDQQAIYMSKFIDHLYQNATSEKVSKRDIRKPFLKNTLIPIVNNRNYYPFEGA